MEYVLISAIVDFDLYTSYMRLPVNANNGVY